MTAGLTRPVMATVAGGLLLPVLPLGSAAAVVVAGLAATLYPFVKRLPLGKTLIVPLVWTWCGIVLPSGDPSSLSFAQAAKLVGMGASVDELTQSCGLTQAEAELMRKLHRS